MAAIFQPRANLFAVLAILATAGLVAGGIAWWWIWPRMDYLRHTDWTVEQPVPFSHQHHVAGLGIDCRFCHTTVETAADAGLPPTYTCMTCHSQIWTNAALLAPVRESLANNTPIAWHRVTDLPDYVYFNHKIHIAKGVGCAELPRRRAGHAADAEGADPDHGLLPRLPSRSRPRICGRRRRSSTPTGIARRTRRPRPR